MLKQKTINSKVSNFFKKFRKISNINHHQRGELRVSITNLLNSFN